MTAPKLRILHVEDDAGAQASVRIALEELDYTVESVTDGLSAIDSARRRAPDLILMALDLPGMDGLRTMETLRAIEALRHVPVIFLTPTDALSTHIELLRAGAAAVLRKPFRLHRLTQAVEHALGRGGKRRPL